MTVIFKDRVCIVLKKYLSNYKLILCGSKIILIYDQYKNGQYVISSLSYEQISQTCSKYNKYITHYDDNQI